MAQDPTTWLVPHAGPQDIPFTKAIKTALVRRPFEQLIVAILVVQG